MCTSLHSRRAKEEQNQVLDVSEKFSFINKQRSSELGVLYAKMFLFFFRFPLDKFINSLQNFSFFQH